MIRDYKNAIQGNRTIIKKFKEIKNLFAIMVKQIINTCMMMMKQKEIHDSIS